MRRSVYLSLLLAPVPVAVHALNNPDFIGSIADVLEIVLATLVLALGLAAACALALRLARITDVRGWATYLALVAVAVLIGTVIRGAVGGLLAAAPFLVAGVIASRARTAPGAPSNLVRTIAVLASCVVLGSCIVRAPVPDRQVIVVGFDGADWPLIDRFREEGRLPGIDALIRSGARAELTTLQPILSPPIWTTIASGVSPDVHHVKDFWSSADQIPVKRIWDVADEHGVTSGVFGYLVTWPPHKESGFLVPGWDAQGTETFPSTLSFIKELEIMGKGSAGISPGAMLRLAYSAVQHGMTVATANAMASFAVARKLGSRDDRSLALDARLLKLRITTDVFCDLLRRTQPSLAVYYNSAVDTVEHLFYKYYAPKGFPDVTDADAATYGRALPRVYEESDRVLRRIRAAGSPKANVVVLSDHGQEPATDLGANWLVIKSVDLLAGLGIADAVRATNIGPSVLIRSTMGGPIGPIAKRLRELRTSGNLPLFTVDEHGTDEIQLRVHAGVEKSEGATVKLGDEDVALSKILEPSGRISGVHRQPAVFVMAGPDIESGAHLEGKTVFDVAPTVLALLRLPVARDLPGEVLSEAFKTDAAGLLPVQLVDTYGARMGVASGNAELDSRSIDNLRSLGYIE